MVGEVRRMRKFKPMGSAAQCEDPRPEVEQWGPAGLPVLQDNFCFLLILQIGYKGLHDSFWVNLGHPWILPSPAHWQEVESHQVDRCGWLTLGHTYAHSLRRSHHLGTGRGGAGKGKGWC